MTRDQIRLQLEQLLVLLQQERECAQALDMPGLQKVVEEKANLLGELQFSQEDVVGLEDLLRQIDSENRRNAFLLWTGLNWVRDLMGFFGNAAMPQVYGGQGYSKTLNEGGRLLSGRI